MTSSKNEEVAVKGRIASRQRSQEGRHKTERRRSFLDQSSRAPNADRL